MQNNDPNATKFIQRDAKKSDQTILEPAGLQNSMQVEVPTLLILSGKLAGQRMEMRTGRDKNEWIIGSNAGLDVTLPDEGVSHVHASIEHEGGRWTLYNKLATNGLIVNGSLTTRRLLESHDRIEFGPVKTQFLLPKSFPLMQAAGSPVDAIRRLGSSPVWLAAAAFIVTLGVIVLVTWILR